MSQRCANPIPWEVLVEYWADDLTPARAEVRQGSLESSNYSAAEAAVKLVGVLRQFEALQRATQLGAEMGRRAVEEVARVNA